MALLDTSPGHAPSARWRDAGFRYGFARLVTHYWRHAAWLEDGALLRDAGKLSGIPGVLIHGRLDIGSPLATAWELAKAWPGSELVVLAAAGHSRDDPGMADALVAATDRFRPQR
jgi:proline iminopeptidase